MLELGRIIIRIIISIQFDGIVIDFVGIWVEMIITVQKILVSDRKP